MREFRGVHDRAVDEKNRIPVPAPYRKILDYEFLESSDRVLELRIRQHSQGFVWLDCLVSSTVADEIEGARRNLMPRSEEWMIFWFGEIANLEKVKLDSQGRILIPRRHLDLARISKHCKIAGAGSYFTLWSPEQWDLFQQRMCTPENIEAVLKKSRGAATERE